ncbi:MAG: hypothetical protein OXE99_14450 [Cellvibrionales bacterium]|nr:hypothetical protein [Cellvibrionales bacterium]
MDQAQLEIELGAWKNIAIDKQVLLSDVYSALGLDDKTSNEELKSTLKGMISQANNADVKIKEAQDNVEKIKQQLAEMQAELNKVNSLKQQADASQEQSIQALEDAKTVQKEAEDKIQAAKKENAEELKKVNQQLRDKQKEIKSIHKVLADSPENVVKKLKSLNKEKHDESTLRKAAEGESRSLRKQVKDLEKDKSNLEETIEKGGDLVESVKELRKVANDLYTKVAESAENKDDVPMIPEIDESLIELFEKTAEEA